MRIVPFVISAIITIALVIVLNIPINVNGNKTPRLGAFLSPQYGFWQNAEPANYNFNAKLSFPQLKGKVDVYFDERLVPHVYAEQEDDAYFVQGYLHAKFRLWQMEFQTHAAAGRLSEIMGDSSGGTNFLEIDKHFRRLGMVYGAEQSLKKLEQNAATKSENDAYTAGVNAYITSLKPNKYPLEYKLLNYKPEKWTTLKSMLFSKYVAYDMTGSDWDFEMTNARKVFSASDLEKLYPAVPDSIEPIIPKGTLFQPASIAVKKPKSADSLYLPARDTTTKKVIKKPVIVKPNKNNGSNNWAVSPAKTMNGAAILCSDPHLGLSLPSIWYEMQITTPEFNVYGVSFPGAPSIIIGFNDSIAWGVTNAARDVKDYYEVTFRDTSMSEYMFNGSWLKTTFRNEIIKVRDGRDDTERIAMTIFGPVMYDRSYPSMWKDGKYYAVRWKALDESNELAGFSKLNRAKNFTDYLRAISNYETPGQNFVFASKSGDIAIRQQGEFPAKWKQQGRFVMPGLDSSYLWQGFIPSRENPTAYNPARGFVSSANQIAADTTYPYYISGEYSYYRGIIINRMLSNMSSVTIEDMQKLQTNNYNVFAEMARPVLLNNIDRSKLNENELIYIKKLEDWNLYSDINEEAPTVFYLWWKSLEKQVYKDEFTKAQLPLKWPEEITLLEALLKDSSYKFVDDITTPVRETLGEVALRAFKDAFSQIREADNDDKLTWGRFKDTRVRHLLKLPSLSRLHLPIGGGENIINATTGNHGPSWRMVVQMSKNVEAYGIYPGGQNGNPGSQYYDQFVDNWAYGKYYKLLFLKPDQLQKNSQLKWKMTFLKA